MKPFDLNVGGIVGQEENWTIELVLRIKDLCSREAVPPSLTIAVDDTRTIDLDISMIMSVSL